MEKLSKYASAGKIAELLDLDRKKVDKAMKELKAEGAIVSPVRFKWDTAHKNHGFPEISHVEVQSGIQHLSLDLIGNLPVDTFNGTQVILAFLAQIRCVVEASVTQCLSNVLLHTWANAQPINEVVIG